MTCRYMRVIVFFDLPTLTASDKRAYLTFRKFLIRDGFFMMQESVYCKLAMNQLSANAIISQIKANKPASGLVQVLTITEKQYSDIESVLGEKQSDVIDSAERMVIL